MSLVGRVGRKRARARLATFLLYAVLAIGAATTVYPFLVMASTGLKGPTDQSDNRLVPEYWTNIDQTDEKGKLSEGALYAKYVNDKYGGNKAAIEATRTGPVAPDELIDTYERFLRDLPPEFWEAGFRPAANQPTSRLVRAYQKWLKSRMGSIDVVNRTYIEENLAFQTVLPPSEQLDQKSWRPRKGRKQPDFYAFRRDLPIEFRLPVRATKMFQDFVRAKFKNQISDVPMAVSGGAKSFEQIPYPASGPYLDEFRALRLPSWYAVATAESEWAKYSDQPMPIEAFERRWVKRNASMIRQEFAGRNYSYVLDFIALNGRALWNTAIFCALAVLLQLVVNPLAAYALSRYPIRASGKILLFLLATMAFPAEVAMIPSFLLLKDLGLLNTFAALALPTAASGYMIFLLKGFFDSLPAELFESAQIDGAKERTALWKIALPLSRPVLGYLALTAFMSAYGAFMFAFVVAQDQRMWTLMVFIYQLQTVAPKSIVMAALTLAAIPTVLVFLLAQRVIMEGIVLPGER